VNEQDFIGLFVPLILRLANNEGNFTYRVSAVNLMIPAYQRAGNQKEKIKTKFLELCSEETPMVRRVVASKIGDLAQVVEKEIVAQDLIQSIK
jgi:serine/threonine-protein phosphatase 2A regulatory subunit A